MTHNNLLTKAYNCIIRSFAALFALLASFNASAKELSPYESHGLWGFVDENNEIVVPAKFDSFNYYSEGLAPVCMQGKWGFIDEKGELVVPCKYDGYCYFSEGLAGVQTGDKWGFIDRHGNMVIAPKYDETLWFKEGICAVRDEYWYFIDKTGKLITDMRFLSGSFFSEGLADVAPADLTGHCYIDTLGNVVLMNSMDLRPFSEGMAAVQADNGKWGYIDMAFIEGKTDTMHIPPLFDKASKFCEGRAVVTLDNKYAVIDRNGCAITPYIYEHMSDYNDGMAAFAREGRFGFLDRDGNEAIKPQFYTADDFVNGVALVFSATGDRFYIDKRGRRYATEQDARRFLTQEAAGGASGGHAVDTRPFAEVAPNYAETFVDVDKDIPQSGVENGNIYALVIANERYDETAPVSHAANDGTAVKAYLTTAFGVPEENIVTVTDGTAVQMDRALKRMKTKTEAAAKVGKKFSVIAYYSGHGMPASDTRDSYLLPTDVAPLELLPYSISLNDLYSRLGELKAEYVAVFLDACFTGNSRSDEPLDAEMKGMMFEPKAGVPRGNMVVFSACKGNETAYAYDKGRHGIFTYWLLRTLKETGGRVTLGELYDRLTRYVPFTATSLDKTQTPTQTSSPDFSWRGIRLR